MLLTVADDDDAYNKRLERTRHERASLLSCVGEPLKRSVMLLRFHREYFLTVLLVAGAFQLSCTRRAPYYWDLPQRPTTLRGWNKATQGTVLTVGSWILSKGESTEGKTFGIKLIDVQPAQICGRGPFGEPGSAKLEFMFYRTTTKEQLCRTTIHVHGTNLDGNLNCSESANLPPSIGIDSYNAKDGWVAFSLAGTAGDVRW